MYLKDGIIYGSERGEPIKIKSVKVLPDSIMLITFNTGETRVFDATVLTGMAFEPLKDWGVFSKPVIDHGVVTWNNGDIDCAPEYMYDHSFEYSDISMVV